MGYRMTPHPENSLKALEAIFRDDELLDVCSGFEFDIRFTKDRISVVIHNQFIDDGVGGRRAIENCTLEELKKIQFRPDVSHKISTLEEVLLFFVGNLSKLDDRLIQIEAKDWIFTTNNNFSKKNLTNFANVLNKFPELSGNIVFTSFWPLNLRFLKKIQKKLGYQLVKNCLLCDHSIVAKLTRFMPNIDGIALRIKGSLLDENCSSDLSKITKLEKFITKFANAAKRKNLEYGIAKYGSVGLYTLSDYSQLSSLNEYMGDNFLNDNLNRIIIVASNPKHFQETKR